MTKPESSSPPDNAPPEETPPTQWIWKVLLTGASLTVAANYLLYSRGPGAGWAIFFLLLAMAFFLNRRCGGLVRGIELGLGLLLVASAAQMVIRPSFSNAVVLFTLSLLASAHFIQGSTRDTPAARKLVEALRNLFLSPLRWLQATELAARSGLSRAAAPGDKVPAPPKIARALQIIVPAAVLVVPFAILLGMGNSILGQFISNTLTGLFDHLEEIEPPSPLRIVFIALVATALLGLLWRSRPSKVIDLVFARLGRPLSAPRDLFVARWRTVLILAGVNVLFFVTNSIDLTYLGAADLKLPEGLTYSEFVHRGTNALITSAVAAAIVLSLLFQQDASVSRSRGVLALALLWIAQNLLLVANVARRVGIYIDDYHLSVLRVHLILFLGLVCVGFLLLAVRILADRSFGWLVSTNLAAAFLMFAGIQFWDTRKLVAEYNLERAISDPHKTLDTYYLARLGPSAWPSLKQAIHSDLSFDERESARQALASIASRETLAAEQEDWRDFRLVRVRLREDLLAISTPAD